jgi:hypothetical protein
VLGLKVASNSKCTREKLLDAQGEAMGLTALACLSKYKSSQNIYLISAIVAEGNDL